MVATVAEVACPVESGITTETSPPKSQTTWQNRVTSPQEMVMVAFPSPTAAIRPRLLTMATDSLLLSNFTVPSLSPGIFVTFSPSVSPAEVKVTLLWLTFRSSTCLPPQPVRQASVTKIRIHAIAFFMVFSSCFLFRMAPFYHGFFRVLQSFSIPVFNIASFSGNRNRASQKSSVFPFGFPGKY
jgi:hypothetical protein